MFKLLLNDAKKQKSKCETDLFFLYKDLQETLKKDNRIKIEFVNNTFIDSDLLTNNQVIVYIKGKRYCDIVGIFNAFYNKFNFELLLENETHQYNKKQLKNLINFIFDSIYKD